METMGTQFPWAMVLILLPLAGGMLCFLWPGVANVLGLLVAGCMVLSVAGLGWQLLQHGVFHHAVGGWGAPLGIELHADGLSLLMLAATALVGLAVSVYSTGYFGREQASRFWPLWLLLLGALNALFLSADIFNLYVTLELMGLAAVSLTALTGSRNALGGAMRYLLATLLGSLLYLLGVALLYHGFGSVDIALLAARVEAVPVAWAALGLMTAGLLLKTALFPMHFWLPPAHASAPAPVSALLSALVVKASFYILLRLWLTVFAPLGAEFVSLLLGLLGCCGRPLGFPAGPASDPAETAGCLFHGRPDRLPVSCVSACRRGRCHGLERGCLPGAFARAGEGGHVSGGRQPVALRRA